MVFTAAARMLLAQGRQDEARALLQELEQTPAIRGDHRYVANLPVLVRCALALGDPALAARLVEDVHPRAPAHEHAFCAARAQLAEADGDHARAAALYEEAARRWQKFGDVPERAYALLGLSRCLVALSDPAAEDPLRDARESFRSMGYRAALEACDALAGQAAAAAG